MSIMQKKEWHFPSIMVPICEAMRYITPLREKGEDSKFDPSNAPSFSKFECQPGGFG